MANHANGGVKITGETSGAIGLVFSNGTSGTACHLTNVVGTFQVGEKLFASDRAGYLVEFGDTKKMFTDPENQKTEEYITCRIS